MDLQHNSINSMSTETVMPSGRSRSSLFDSFLSRNFRVGFKGTLVKRASTSRLKRGAESRCGLFL